MKTSTLMQRYTEHTERLKAQGVKLLSFDCPACGDKIETRRPPRGDTWDTLANCPHCEAMYFQEVTHTKATGFVPKEG